jgi:hypothetical protein
MVKWCERFQYTCVAMLYAYVSLYAYTHSLMPFSTHRFRSFVRPWNTSAGSVVIWLLLKYLLRHTHGESGEAAASCVRAVHCDVFPLKHAWRHRYDPYTTYIQCSYLHANTQTDLSILVCGYVHKGTPRIVYGHMCICLCMHACTHALANLRVHP